jgi:hypothetical protein
MILEVKSKQDIKRFVTFIRSIYEKDPLYVFPIFRAIVKELNNEVLVKKEYHAILSEQNGIIQGRLLYTFSYSKQKKKVICFFSFFDAIDNQDVVDELFDYMEEDMRKNAIDYVEGTYSPYSPDTRRGILVEGFYESPTFLCSYNFPYYPTLLEKRGFLKVYDTHSLSVAIDSVSEKRIRTLAAYFEKRHHVRVDSLNMKNLDQDIIDIHEILKIATVEMNYQDPPSIEMIQSVKNELSFFLRPSLIKIAREESTNKPVGFCFLLPDFNQILKKTKGRMNIITFLRERNKIKKVRGIMQYIVPEYQSTGLIGFMFYEIGLEFLRTGITELEAGTILEENVRSSSVFDKIGGKIIKTYRIYGKEIQQ